MSDLRRHVPIGLLLLATLGLRLWRADQPIVENYVGRQVPTAMVARNLARGSGFGYPRLDTGPFPNLFLVEPPVYASAVVALRRATGLALEPAGRAVSAIGITLAAWGLFGLVQRRQGGTTALVAVGVFALLPVTIRYGRAFQPDALMLGMLVAGLRCWDESESARSRSPRAVLWMVAGVLLVSLGLALKIVSAYVLVPLVVVILRPRPWWKLGLVAMTLLPALLWYGHSARLLSTGVGSQASVDNGRIWLRSLIPTAWLDLETWRVVGWALLVRVLTPIGTILGIIGIIGAGNPWCGPGRLWVVWSASALAALGLMAAKLHHEYYWLAIAPTVAVGIAWVLVEIGRRGRWGRIAAVAVLSGFVVMALAISASTWTTPREWVNLPVAARMVREHVPRHALIIAPEALIYSADRRGCRLEFGPASAARAAGEWRAVASVENVAASQDPTLALVEFYRQVGARYLADLGDAAGGAERLALHVSVRRRYAVLVDRPEVFVADLSEPVELGSDP